MATKKQLFNYIKKENLKNLENDKKTIIERYRTKGFEELNNYLKLSYNKRINKNTFKALKETEKETFILKHLTTETIKKYKRVCNEINEILNAPDLKKLEIKNEWKSSRTWGANPHAKGWALTAQGWEMSHGWASGCGYDKLSAAYNLLLLGFESKSIHKLFYKALLKKWDGVSKITNGDLLPYGTYFYSTGLHISLGGCGVSAVVNALEWVGLKVKTLSGNTWDYLEAERTKK